MKPYEILGDKPAHPAPTLFIFSSTAHVSLTDPYYRQCADFLIPKGFLCVSVDLPCHGSDRQPSEPAELEGWRARADRGDDFVGRFTGKLSGILDELIVTGHTDSTRVAASGISRGGFIALHWMAVDERVRAAAAFAPVTDLMALIEFQGTDASRYALHHVAGKLTGRNIWMTIGDQDHRVGTDRAAEFARMVAGTRLVFSIVPGTPGHTTPSGSFEKAATWISQRMAIYAPTSASQRRLCRDRGADS